MSAWERGMGMQELQQSETWCMVDAWAKLLLGSNARDKSV